ncbi:hypothetical protein MPNTM1_04603 [Mycolicibacterium parafortuitum]
MSTATVPAEFGQPYLLKREGNRLRVSRQADNGFTHVLVFRHAEAVAVADAMIDLLEQDN